MIEQTHGSGHSLQGRSDHRAGQGKSRQTGGRSERATNLARLGDALGLDLLGAALGLTDDAMRTLVNGRDHAREEQYAAHMSLRLKEAGIPAGWLDRQGVELEPQYLQALRGLAATARNKAPIRRANFRRIASAFDGREAVLADALEMIPSAVANVAEGRLEFDDGRFGHVNPRLMRAGFPDGWLEQAEPDLPDTLIESLAQLATDDYERTFEEESVTHADQAFVSPAPRNESEPSVQPAAAPVDTIKETAMAPKTPAQTDQPAIAPPKPEFKAGGIPTRARPMAHPAANKARLPRGVLASGRQLAPPAAKGAAAPAAAKAPATVAAKTPAPLADKSAAQPSKATPAANKPATEASTAGAATERRSPAPRGTVSKEVSLARAEALEKLLENSRRGAKVLLWRDILGSSLPFWGNIRRGSVLFRDELAEGVVKAMGLPEGWLDNPSFPPATMAAWVTDKDAPIPPAQVYGDKQDAGSQTADQGGDAVDNGAAPAPALQAQAPAPAAKSSGAAPKRDASKPFARSTAPQPPTVTMTSQPPAKAPVSPGAPAAGSAPAEGATSAGGNTPDSRQLELVDMGAPAPGAPVVAAPAPTPAPAPALAAVSSPHPQATQAPVAAVPSDVGPFAAAGALLQAQASAPGPLTQALISIITAKAATGSFTETDALGIINKLMTA
jgi:hypothetical protein